MPIGNPDNGRPNSLAYIPDRDLRLKVNRHLDHMADLAIACKRRTPGAEADYHRAAADLMTMRPAIDADAEARQVKNAQHLRQLAARLDAGLVEPQMLGIERSKETA